jgi:hypothetical protein
MRVEMKIGILMCKAKREAMLQNQAGYLNSHIADCLGVGICQHWEVPAMVFCGADRLRAQPRSNRHACIPAAAVDVLRLCGGMHLRLSRGVRGCLSWTLWSR